MLALRSVCQVRLLLLERVRLHRTERDLECESASNEPTYLTLSLFGCRHGSTSKNTPSLIHILDVSESLSDGVGNDVLGNSFEGQLPSDSRSPVSCGAPGPCPRDSESLVAEQLYTHEPFDYVANQRFWIAVVNKPISGLRRGAFAMAEKSKRSFPCEPRLYFAQRRLKLRSLNL